ADDRAFGRGDARDDRFAVLTGDQDFPDRADYARCGFASAALGQRVEPVLRVELFGDDGGAEGDAADRPVAFATVHREIGVPSLVRAVECADAEVDDAGALGGAVVGEAGDLGRE